MAEYERTSEGELVEVRRTGSSPIGWIVAIVIIVAVVVAAFAFGLINIDQTREARVPDVKVETSGGQTPAFDVSTAKVDVGTKTESIDVPTVGTEKKDIEVPTMSVTKADEQK